MFAVSDSAFGVVVLINQFGVIYLFRLVRVFAGQGDDYLVDLAGEGEVILRLVVVRDGRAVIHADIEGFAERKGSTNRFINGSFRHLLAVHIQLAGAFEHPGFDEVELEVHFPLGQHGRDDRVALGVHVVVIVVQLVIGNEQAVTTVHTATRDDDPLFAAFQVECGLDGVRPIFDRRGNRLGNALGSRRVVGEYFLVAKGAAELLGYPAIQVVIERVHVVLPSLLIPELLEFLQFLGILVGEVVGFGEVLVEVIQFPHVLLEGEGAGSHPRHAVAVDRDRFPAILVHRPVTELLVILLGAGGGRVGLVKGIGEADAIQRHLLYAVDLLHELGASNIERRGHEVDDVAVLIPDFAPALDAFGPGDNETVGYAAIVDDLFAILEGGVPGHGPARVIVRIGVGPAPVVVVLHVLLEGRLHAVDHERFVIQAVQAAFAA